MSWVQVSKSPEVWRKADGDRSKLMKWNVFEMVFNPNRGDMKTFLQSVYAETKEEAMQQARRIVSRGQTPIVEPAR
jgi:hypothetical protein